MLRVCQLQIPLRCDEFSEPPTFLLCFGVLNPELILNGVPAASRALSNMRKKDWSMLLPLSGESGESNSACVKYFTFSLLVEQF